MGSQSSSDTTSDDSDNTQEPRNVESQESHSMITTTNGLEMVEESETSSASELGVVGERILMSLYTLVHMGDWANVKYFLELHPKALTTQISTNGDTALHIAVLCGHVKIVEGLVHMMKAKDLELQNETGETALSLAAAGGVIKVAKPLVRKNHDLLRLKNRNKLIPVVVAAQFCHVGMVHFLYHETQEEDLDAETRDQNQDLDPETRDQTQGGMLLETCIIAKIYDVALDLVQRFPGLATADKTLVTLATRQSAFTSASRLAFWKQWIYYCMPVHSLRVSNIPWDIEAHPGIPRNQQNFVPQALNHLYGLIWDVLKFLVPCIKRIHDKKVKCVQVHDLLGCISHDISALNHSEIRNTKLFEAVFSAIRHGNSKFVEEILTAYPDIVWTLDEEDRNIFLLAVLQRQEKIFCLLHRMGPRKNLLSTSLDKNGNTILHHAAMISPSSHLDHIPGAALQMQRELQWFEEVKKVVKPMYREIKNAKGMTAHSLFTLEHEEMRKLGEKWMKDTATSCTVVATLVATIMFTAVFTVPGGYNNETGDPLYLDHDYFVTFIVADGLSLFSSASSVLMFLGILKSRYSEGEFLLSLPFKLIMGIAALFFSIVTMMLTFATAIYIVLHDRLSWIYIPVVLFSCIPVMFFIFLQVPLLYDIFVSTFGTGIFKRPNKH